VFKNCIPKEGVEEAWKTKGPMGPISEARYITEDIPYGLVTYSSFGKMIGVETPTIDAVIQLSSVMNQKNYMQEGRTITRLRIGEMSIKKLNQFLYEGY
jgi:opine dehydrogenase